LLAQNDISTSKLATAMVLLLLTTIALVACGGSSSNATTQSAQAGAATLLSSTPSTGTPSTTAKSRTATPGSGGKRGSGGKPSLHSSAPASRPKLSQVLKRYSACLHEHGVRPTSKSGSIDLGQIGSAAYRAAAKSCAPIITHAFPATRERVVVPPKRAGASPRRSHLQPALARALQKFAACMRENGVNLPPPNIGKGEIFNTSHLNKNSPQFKAAENKCNKLLQGTF
jgi:hypothetical protein